MARGRYEEARREVMKAAKMNNADFPEDLMEEEAEHLVNVIISHNIISPSLSFYFIEGSWFLQSLIYVWQLYNKFSRLAINI